MDIDKLAEAAAKMRQPEIHMHPDAVQRLGIANGHVGDEDSEQLSVLVPPSGIAIVADDAVEPGHMWLVDAAPDPVPTFLVPAPIAPEVFAEMDRMRYVRRPWNRTGRAATRARWNRKGRGR